MATSTASVWCSQDDRLDLNRFDYVISNELVETSVSGEIQQVYYAGDRYSYGVNIESLQPGEYFVQDGKLYLKPFSNIYSEQQAYLYVSKRDTFGVRVLCAEPSNVEYFRRLNINGTLNWNRSFEGIPSCNFTFDICEAQKEDIVCQISTGEKITALGNKWVIGTPTFKRKTNNIKNEQQDLDNTLQVSIPLISVHGQYGNPSRSPVDREVNKRSGVDCNSTSKLWRSLSSYAAAAGTKYFGKPLYTRIPKNTSSSETVTLRSLVTPQRARVVNGFVYWSNPEGIQVKNWNQTPFHILPSSEVLSLESENYTGLGATIDAPNKIRLRQEYRNTELQINYLDESDEQDGLIVRWKFENALSYADCQTPAEPIQIGDGIYITKNPTKEILRNPGLAFDVGGFSKTAHKIFELFGVEVFKITKQFGWVFNSTQVYSVVDKDAVLQTPGITIRVGDYFKIIFTPFAEKAFLTSFWSEVRHEISDRIYDDDEKYLRTISTTGTKLGRLKQDSSSLEGITTLFNGLELLRDVEVKYGDAIDTDLEAINLRNTAISTIQLSTAYRFTRTIPINVLASYHLEPYRKYFDDINRPNENDCEWVEPRFVKTAMTVERTVITADNPGSTSKNPLPPIQIGKISRDRQDTVVTHRKKVERHITSRSTESKEGEGLERKITVQGAEEKIGRPSIQQRLQEPKTIRENPPVLIDGNSDYKYLLNTFNSNPNGKLSAFSISFPDVYSIRVGLSAAKTDIQIANSRAHTVSLLTFYNPLYNEGDRVTWDNKAWVILEINCSWQVEPERFTGGMQLLLGQLLTNNDLPVSLKRVLQTPKSGTATATVNNLYAVDGNAAYLNSVYNYADPETIANLQKLGLLDEFAEENGIKLKSLADFDSANLGLNNGDFEVTTNDLSTSDAANFIDLANRIALVEEFNQAFLDKFAELLAEAGIEVISPTGSSSENGGDLGGGGSFTTSGGLEFNLIGENSSLAGLLSSLFDSLKDLAETLSDGVDTNNLQDGGAGGGGAGGGGAGGGSGDLQFGDLIVNMPTPDYDGLLAALLDLIAQLIGLVGDFELDFLISTLTAAAESNGGLLKGGGAGGGLSGNNSSTDSSAGGTSNIDGSITIIFPDNANLATDLSTLFAQLDLLFAALNQLAQQEFTFQIDIGILESTGANSPSLSSGSNTNFADNFLGNNASLEDGLVGGGISGSSTSTGSSDSFGSGNPGEFNSDNASTFNSNDPFGGANILEGTNVFTTDTSADANFIYPILGKFIYSDFPVETRAIALAGGTFAYIPGDLLILQVPPGYSETEAVVIDDLSETIVNTELTKVVLSSPDTPAIIVD